MATHGRGVRPAARPRRARRPAPAAVRGRGAPPCFANALERQRGHQRLAARRSAILLQGLQAVARALGDEPFVVLKGADYARRLYARPDLRPMQDLDILVPRTRLPQVYEARVGAAAVPRRRVAAYADSAHERPFVLGAWWSRCTRPSSSARATASTTTGCGSGACPSRRARGRPSRGHGRPARARGLAGQGRVQRAARPLPGPAAAAAARAPRRGGRAGSCGGRRGCSSARSARRSS